MLAQTTQRSARPSSKCLSQSFQMNSPVRNLSVPRLRLISLGGRNVVAAEPGQSLMSAWSWRLLCCAVESPDKLSIKVEPEVPDVKDPCAYYSLAPPPLPSLLPEPFPAPRARRKLTPRHHVALRAPPPPLPTPSSARQTCSTSISPTRQHTPTSSQKSGSRSRTATWTKPRWPSSSTA